jgi:hypothetical protein
LAPVTSPTDLAAWSPGRLRRQETTGTRYCEGQPFEIAYVPQIISGVDLGHVMLCVDGATIAFYGRNYRSGLSIVRRDEGVIVSPCPLHAKAHADPSLRERIVVLHSGKLNKAQAEALNDWASRLELSVIRDRERGMALIPGTYYQALARCEGCENCATFLMNRFDASELGMHCPLGLPRLCREFFISVGPTG